MQFIDFNNIKKARQIHRERYIQQFYTKKFQYFVFFSKKDFTNNKSCVIIKQNKEYFLFRKLKTYKNKTLKNIKLKTL